MRIFSYDDPRYPQQGGRQMSAVKRMVDRLTGVPAAMIPTPPPAPPAKCRPGKCT